MTNKKLYRNEDEAILAGVCSGLADYFEIDATLMRVIFVVLAIGGGSGLLIYIILWIVTPVKKETEVINRENNAKEFAEDLGKKTKNIAKEMKKEIKSSKKRPGSALGIILMVFGVLILLDKLVPMIIRWDYVWPVTLILLGGYFMFRE